MGNFIKKALLGSAIFTAGAAFGVVAALAYKKTMEELENLDMVDYEEDEEVKIIRTKKFGIKPMYPEDACVQMELLGHNFFVFFNAETEQVNVVYKRKGNTYGLIEPEF